MPNFFRVPDVTLHVSNIRASSLKDFLWVKPELPSRGSALTEEVRQEDWHEDDFCVGSPSAFPRGLGVATAAKDMLRDVLNLFFRILGLLCGRLRQLQLHTFLTQE